MDVQLPQFQGLAVAENNDLLFLVEFQGVPAMYVPLADALQEYPDLLSDLVAKVVDAFYNTMFAVALVQAEGDDAGGEDEDFLVEHIVGDQFVDDNLLLGVKWVNFEVATWEPAPNCVDADAAFAAFIESVMHLL